MLFIPVHGSEQSYAMNKASQEFDLCIKEQAIEHQTSVLHDKESTERPYQANSPFLDIEEPPEDRASRLILIGLFMNELWNELPDLKMKSTNPSVLTDNSAEDEPSNRASNRASDMLNTNSSKESRVSKTAKYGAEVFHSNASNSGDRLLNLLYRKQRENAESPHLNLSGADSASGKSYDRRIPGLCEGTTERFEIKTGMCC